MSIAKKSVHFISFLFLVGATLMCFFLILSGGKSSGVLKNFYWLEANTLGFNDASPVTRWFDYEFCGYARGQLDNCSSRAPAKPFSPRDNFGPSDLMPSTFLDNRDTYYYLSRVGWAMLLIGLFFEVLALVPSFITIVIAWTPLLTLYTVLIWLAFFFILLAACLYTGCYAKAIRGFHSQDRHAKMGAKNFAFLWTSVFLLLCSTVWTTVTIVLHNRTYGAKARRHDLNAYTDEYANTYPASADDTTHLDKSTYNTQGQDELENQPLAVQEPVAGEQVATVERNPPDQQQQQQDQQQQQQDQQQQEQQHQGHHYFTKLKTKKSTANNNANDNSNNPNILTTTREEVEETVQTTPQ